MGTVDGLTKARMLEIEGNSVVSGAIDDTTGHLILTQHDGDTIDAGKARPDTFGDASTTNKGVATLATQAEVIAGTVTDEIVTPATLQGKTATNAEALLAALATKIVTPANLAVLREEFSGYIDVTWSGLGTTAPVVLDAGQPLTGTITANVNISELGLKAGDRVMVARAVNSGTYWVTQSFPSFNMIPKSVAIPLQNGWALYNDINDPTEEYGSPKYQLGAYGLMGASSANAGSVYATMSRYGIVRVEGLLQRSSGLAAPAVGSVIFTLPVGMRPEREQVFVGVNASAACSVVVCPNGDVLWQTGNSTTYCSVSNICFRAKSAVDLGLATFTSILPYMNAGWAAWTGTNYTGGSTVHTPGYTKDADGVVIFEGTLVATSAYAGSAIAGRLTAIGFNYPRACHQYAWSPSVGPASFRFGTQASASLTGTQAINFNTAMAATNYIHLSQNSLVDPGSATAPKVPGTVRNAWVTYDANWREACFNITPDGQIFLGGLWSTGALGTAMMGMPRFRRPNWTLIMQTIANAANARLDVKMSGDITPNFGSTAWFTLDGLSYSAYR